MWIISMIRSRSRWTQRQLKKKCNFFVYQKQYLGIHKDRNVPPVIWIDCAIQFAFKAYQLLTFTSLLLCRLLLFLLQFPFTVFLLQRCWYISLLSLLCTMMILTKQNVHELSLIDVRCEHACVYCTLQGSIVHIHKERERERERERVGGGGGGGGSRIEGKQRGNEKY